jgi:hypothetical protein
VDFREGLAQSADAPARLSEEAAETHAGGARQQESAGIAIDRALEPDGDPLQLALATDEPVAPKLAVRRASIEAAALAVSVVAVGHISRSQVESSTARRIVHPSIE